MNGSLFALVNVESPDQIVAWGMEITFDDLETASEHSLAVVYRHDPVSHEETHSRHVSAEAALDAYNRVLPIKVELIWQPGCLEHGAHEPG